MGMAPVWLRGALGNPVHALVWLSARLSACSRASCTLVATGEHDADKCIELNPAFAKGYSRKAHVQFFCKEYEKALETYEKGLSYDPENVELREGAARCRNSINRFMTGMASEDEIKERQAKAMADPEVRARL